MKNKKQGPVISDPGCEELLLSDSVPEQDACGTESRNADKKTPVYIWYDDIKIDNIKRKVEEQIGFTSNDIENIYYFLKNHNNTYFSMLQIYNLHQYMH